jgi:hypothetical protein
VADPLQIWKMLPALQSLPDELLMQMSRSEILQLNAALVKESKAAEKLQANARLTLNAQHLAANPVQLPAGPDDRKMILHKARFLGGVSCSAQSLWLMAREEIGPHGVTPLGRYAFCKYNIRIIHNMIFY